MTMILILLATVQATFIFLVMRDSSVRRIELRYKLKRRKTLEQNLSAETESAADAIERLTMQVTELDGRLQEELAIADRVEKRKYELKARPPVRLYVFDRLTLTSENIWEVTISNEAFHELASAKRAPASLIQEWAQGRIFLLGGSTGEDAASRAGARFPGSLGYRVENIAPFRGARS